MTTKRVKHLHSIPRAEAPARPRGPALPRAAPLSPLPVARRRSPPSALLGLLSSSSAIAVGRRRVAVRPIGRRPPPLLAGRHAPHRGGGGGGVARPFPPSVRPSVVSPASDRSARAGPAPSFRRLRDEVDLSSPTVARSRRGPARKGRETCVRPSLFRRFKFRRKSSSRSLGETQPSQARLASCAKVVIPSAGADAAHRRLRTAACGRSYDRAATDESSKRSSKSCSSKQPGNGPCG